MFWDSSALVPCLVPELSSVEMTALLAGDGAITVWWATRAECLSALEAKRRNPSSPLPMQIYTTARQRLASLVASAAEVQPASKLRERAEEYLTRHPLRTADALQLAAAFVSGLREIACLDQSLALAARAEGFAVLP